MRKGYTFTVENKRMMLFLLRRHSLTLFLREYSPDPPFFREIGFPFSCIAHPVGIEADTSSQFAQANQISVIDSPHKKREEDRTRSCP